MKNNLQFLQINDQTTAKFLLCVNRATYRARLVTSQAIHVAAAGEWDIEVKSEEEVIIVSFPRGRILDSQNRAWMRGVSAIQPAHIVIPYEYPVSLSSLGVHPRYYLQLLRACSLTLESTVSIDARQETKSP